MENVIQAKMDANIRRCGLFGVISVALGLLLRIGLMPVASGHVDWDDSIWLNVERYANVAISLFGFIAWCFFSGSATSGARLFKFYYLPVSLVGLLLALVGKLGLARMCVHYAASISFIVLMSIIVVKNAGEIRRISVSFLIGAVIGFVGGVVVDVAMMSGRAMQSMRVGDSVFITLLVSRLLLLVPGLVYVFAFLKMLFSRSDLAATTESGDGRHGLIPLYWRIFVAVAPWLCVMSGPAVARTSPLLFMAPLGLLVPFLGNAMHGSGKWLLVCGWLVYVFVSISIAFSRVRWMFVLTVAIMLVLLTTNAVGCVRLMSHL